MNTEKMFAFMRGFVTARPELTDTAKALYFAQKWHRDQCRKSGEPYIVHPLTMACQAVALGLVDDNILAACLMHDILEDCEINLSALSAEKFSRETISITARLTKASIGAVKLEDKEDATKVYYNAIAGSPKAAIVKLIDRCNNISTMAGAFSKEKIEEYCKETRDFVLPLAKNLKHENPEYSNVIMLLKYHIESVLNMAELYAKADNDEE